MLTERLTAWKGPSFSTTSTGTTKNVTTDQAVEIYARFCRAQYGSKARDVGESTSARLRRTGDTEGAKVWAKVGEQIDRAGEAEHSATRRTA